MHYFSAFQIFLMENNFSRLFRNRFFQGGWHDIASSTHIWSIDFKFGVYLQCMFLYHLNLLFYFWKIRNLKKIIKIDFFLNNHYFVIFVPLVPVIMTSFLNMNDFFDSWSWPYMQPYNSLNFNFFYNKFF